MHDSLSRMAQVVAPAKINLSLLVGPRRADGYHPICSVMEKIKLFDRLRTLPGAEGSGIGLTGSGIPPAANIVRRAALALEGETGQKLDVDIELKKEIPVAAGLAGGSSDAAAIIKLLVFVFGLDVSPKRLRALALALGADVPFFLTRGPQLARGVGEELQPLPGLPDYALVLVKPRQDLSTAAVYARFDETTGPRSGSGAPGDATGGSGLAFEDRCDRLIGEVNRLEGAASLPAIMRNDLEPAAAILFPELEVLKQRIMATGALGALMSGSGSSVFGVYAGREAAETAAVKLRRFYPLVWAAEPFRE